MALVSAAGLCFASGFVLLTLAWSRRGLFAADLLLRISLSVGFGLGIFSVVYFFALICGSKYGFKNLLLIDFIVLALLITVGAVRIKRQRVKPVCIANVDDDHFDDEHWPSSVQHALTAAFGVSLVVAVYSGIVRMLAFPHGNGWDAFTIWNLHARFLYLGSAAHWRDGFSPLVGGSHPDYPLLLPAAIAHFWSYLGHDDPRVPAVIGIAFLFATVGVVFAALWLLRGRVPAMMAGIALLSTPFLIEQGADQYADIPLSFFLVATVVLLCLFDSGSDESSRSLGLLVLAGLAGGFAAWTKNEGLLFLLGIATARLLLAIRSANRSDKAEEEKSRLPFQSAVFPLLTALLPGLLLVVYYKHSIGVPGDLFSDPATALPKLMDPARYWVILVGYVKDFFRFGHWLWIPGTVLLAGLWIVSRTYLRIIRQAGFRTAVLALALTFAGYFVVFLVTPYDIHWHLRFSLVRLFLQLWPSVVFLLFLALQGPSASPESAS